MSLREKKSVFSNGVSQGHQSFSRAGHESNSEFIVVVGLFLLLLLCAYFLFFCFVLTFLFYWYFVCFDISFCRFLIACGNIFGFVLKERERKNIRVRWVEMWKDLGAGEEKMTKIYCRKTFLNYGIKIKNVTQV